MRLPKLRIAHLEPLYPIVQGGMGVRISTAPLASAVAKAGGIGTLSAAEYHNKNRKTPKTDVVRGTTISRPYIYAPLIAEEIRQAKAGHNGIIGVNIMYAITDFYDLVMTSVDAGVDFIVTGAGFSRDIYGMVRDFGVPVISICDQPGLAKIAERLGAAAIVVEGKEAGGHLGTDKPTRELLPRVVDAVSIPVIAAGGIWSGEDMEEMFRLGASGVQMATRLSAPTSATWHLSTKRCTRLQKKTSSSSKACGCRAGDSQSLPGSGGERREDQVQLPIALSEDM